MYQCDNNHKYATVYNCSTVNNNNKSSNNTARVPFAVITEVFARLLYLENQTLNRV